jgi:arylsulfatase A-like enzyme
LLKVPGVNGQSVQTPFNQPDVLPTLCGLSAVPVPPGVQGRNYAPEIHNGNWTDEAALIANYQPFGQWPMVPIAKDWTKSRAGKEWRGIRTQRYSYVRDLNGPWLMFDNQIDPLQRTNLVNQPQHAALQEKLEGLLQEKLRVSGDDFQDGMTYIGREGYHVDRTGTIAYEE